MKKALAMMLLARNLTWNGQDIHNPIKHNIQTTLQATEDTKQGRGSQKFDRFSAGGDLSKKKEEIDEFVATHGSEKLEPAEEAKYRYMCFSYLLNGWQDSTIQKIYQWLFADTWFNDEEKWAIASKVKVENIWATEKFFWTAKEDTTISIPTISDPDHGVESKIVCMGPSINEDLKTQIWDICQMIGVNADDWTIEAIVEVFNRQTWDRIASDYGTIRYYVENELSEKIPFWMDKKWPNDQMPNHSDYQQILNDIDRQIAKKYQDNYRDALAWEIKYIVHTLYTDLYTAYLQDRDTKEIEQNITELKKQYSSYKPDQKILSISLSKFLYDKDLRAYIQNAPDNKIAHIKSLKIWLTRRQWKLIYQNWLKNWICLAVM